MCVKYENTFLKKIIRNVLINWNSECISPTVQAVGEVSSLHQAEYIVSYIQIYSLLRSSTVFFSSSFWWALLHKKNVYNTKCNLPPLLNHPATHTYTYTLTHTDTHTCMVICLSFNRWISSSVHWIYLHFHCSGAILHSRFYPFPSP